MVAILNYYIGGVFSESIKMNLSLTKRF